MACFCVIVSISGHCRPINFETFYWSWDILLISGHNIYFETLYLFWDFVFISRHRAETSYSFQYQFRDIVSILRHCIYLEILYSYRDRSETCSFQESAYISVFPCHWKEAKKKKFHILDLKIGLDIVHLQVEPP